MCVRDLEDQDVVGVTLDDGEQIAANDVVLATDSPSTATLAATVGVTLDAGLLGVGSTSVYFKSARAPLPGKSLWLNGDVTAAISHAITLTEVVPEYVNDRALTVATAVGAAATLDDDALDLAARSTLAHFAKVGGAQPVPELTRVAVWRVPYSASRSHPDFIRPPPESARM